MNIIHLVIKAFGLISNETYIVKFISHGVESGQTRDVFWCLKSELHENLKISTSKLDSFSH